MRVRAPIYRPLVALPSDRKELVLAHVHLRDIVVHWEITTALRHQSRIVSRNACSGESVFFCQIAAKLMSGKMKRLVQWVGAFCPTPSELRGVEDEDVVVVLYGNTGFLVCMSK